MSLYITESDWVTIPSWQTANVSLLTGTGLLRLRWDENLIYYGYAASRSTGFRSRIAAYRRGDGPEEYAAHKIFKHQSILELQIVQLDAPRMEIRNLCHDLIKRDRPSWNKPKRYPGRY